MKYIDYLTELYPEYDWNWHHILIAGEIDKWLDGKSNNKLMIFAPPRSSKSTLTSKTLPAYIQEYYHSDMIMTITHSNDYATRCLERALKKIQIERRLPCGRQKFGGAGVQFSGCHIDYGIIDDINLYNEDTSMIQKHLDWYNSMFRTRLSYDSKQLIICSSIPGCLAKQILDQAKKIGETWTVIRIKYAQEPIIAPSDKMEVPYWQQAQANHSISELKRVSANSLDWETIYQQELL